MNARAPYDAASDPRVNLTAEVLGEAQTNRFPIVASQFARRDRAGLMFGASIALLLGSATLFALSSSRQNAKLPPPQVAETPAAGLMAPAPGIVPPPPAPAAIAPPPVPAPVMAPPPRPQPPANNSMSGADRLRAPAVVFDSGANAGGNAPAMGPAAPAVAAIPRPRPSREGMTPEEMFAERAAGKAESATADRMENPATTVAQGTLMAAVLETAINSDLPGYVRAVISQDVKSYDGRRVMIPRGSHLIGEYKSGLAVGQSRAYILWTRLLRPDGVSIALASPATDFSGANGLGGKVDGHFMKRFGAAILLSVIGAAGQAVGGGTGTVILSGPQQAVSAGAQRDISIPPTVKVALGQPIRVFTARDLDFSAVSDGR